MRTFWLLLKIQLLGLFGINRTLHTKPGRLARGLALVAAAALLIGAAAIWYVVTISDALVQVGAGGTVPLLAIEAGSFAGAMTAFLKANGVLFSFRDYDLVMSLPIRRFVIVLSRIAALYAMAVLACALVVVPALVVCAQAGVLGVGPGALLGSAALIFLLAPVIPTAVAIALAALVALASTRFRRANLAMGVLGIVVVVAVVVGMFALTGADGLTVNQGASTLDAAQVTGIQGTLGAYVPAVWATRGVVAGDAGALALFAGVSLAAAGVLVAALARAFVPINEALRFTRPQASFSFGGAGEKSGPGGRGRRPGRAGLEASRALRARSPQGALVAKEARLLLATPVYLLNSCVGVVLALVLGVAALVARLTGGLDLEAQLPAGLVPYLIDMLPWVPAFCLAISSTTAASVSLEGSSAWLMRTAPLGTGVLLGAKVALGLLIAVPAAVVSGVTLALAFGTGAGQTVALVAAPLAMGAFSALVGVSVDALRPRFDWKSSYEPVKRGFAVIVTLLCGMVVTLGGFFAAVAWGWAGTLAASVVVVVVSLAVFAATVRRGLPV